MNKRLVLLLVVLTALTLVLCSCGGEEQGNNGNNGNNGNQDGGTTVDTWETLRADMSVYNVVYGVEEDTNVVKMIKSFTGAVNKLASAAKKKGLNATISDDLDSIDNQDLMVGEVGEIIFGTTNRAGTRYTSSIVDSELGRKEYRIEVVGKDIVVHYSDAPGLSSAIQELLTKLMPDAANSVSVYQKQLSNNGYVPGNIRPKNVYADGMLLQQLKVTTFTGTSSPNVEVEVALVKNGTKVASGLVVADANGYWDAPVTMPAGSYDAYEVVIYADGVPTVSYEDVLVGELWIATGQSNMAYTTLKDVSVNTADYNDNYMRFMRLSTSTFDYSPQYENKNTYWMTGTEEKRMEDLSSVAFYFTKEMRKELDMPVGCIMYAVGGCPIRSWLSKATIKTNEALKSKYTTNGYYITSSASWDAKVYKQCSAVYNTMTSALKGFTVGGLIWCQGCQDMGEFDADYTTELELFYNQFKAEFGWDADGKMPMIIAGLHNYYVNSNPNTLSDFAVLNLAFVNNHADCCAYIPCSDQTNEFNTFDSPLTNIGNNQNSASHPHNKQLLGTHMGMAGAAIVTKNGNPISAPVITSVRTEGSAIICTFSNVGDGLMLQGNTAYSYIQKDYLVYADSTLHGFTICGADGKYIQAKAEIISKNEVKVWHTSIASPVGVSYGYGYASMYYNLASSKNGQPLFMAAPSYANKPANAIQMCYVPWMTCDQEILWRVTRTGNHWGLLRPAWQKSGSVTKLTYDVSGGSYAGRGCLVVEYGTGTFAINPCNTGWAYSNDGVTKTENVTYADYTFDYSKYGKMTFMVKNTGTSAVEFKSVKINSTYYKVVTDTASSVPADGQWHQITVDLSKPMTSGGVATTAVSKMTSIRFNFESATAGSILFDEIEVLP